MERALGHLEKLARDFPEAAEEAVNQVAERHANIASGIVPVHTGSLQKSIRIESESEGTRFSATVIAGGKVVSPKTGRIVDYAIYVEYGTSKMAAQPFMEPAYFATMRDAGSIIREFMERFWR